MIYLFILPPATEIEPLRGHFVVVVQLLSHAQLFVTPWTAAPQAPLSSTIFQSFLKFMSLELVMPSNHLILCLPLLPTSVFPSIRVFSRVSSSHQVAKVLELPLHYSCLENPMDSMRTLQCPSS